jgi:hypothetical protein
MSIDNGELQKLVEKAGVGKRTAKKLLDANGGESGGATPPARSSSRGHGAATRPDQPIGDI